MGRQRNSSWSCVKQSAPGGPTRAAKASQQQASAACSSEPHLPARCSTHRLRLSVLLVTACMVAPESPEDVTWKRSLSPSRHGPGGVHNSLPGTLTSLVSLATVVPQVSEVQQHVPPLHNTSTQGGNTDQVIFVSAPQLLRVFHTPMRLSEIKGGAEGAVLQTQLP